MIRTRKFLAPYDGLFSALGCPAFSQPPPLPPRAASAMTNTTLGSKMNEFRLVGELVDVCFEAEGVQMPAHKIVLAATSELCKSHFAGQWGQLTQNQEKLVIPFEYGLRKVLTLSTMLDFAYGGRYVGPQLKNNEDTEEIADRLDEMLDLLVCADSWQMIGLRDQVEDFLTEQGNATIYRRADNVESVEEIAGKANATRLVRHCHDYMGRNKIAMERLKKS